MKYIDKYSRHKEAHDFNVQFLKFLREQGSSSLNGRNAFEKFKEKYGRRNDSRGWRHLLYEEQDGRCCYCMRRLSDKKGEVSYEHVIPCSLKGELGQKEYAYYAEQAPALRDFVEMEDVFAEREFVSVEDWDRQEKMPHTIALANLLAACNGKRELRSDDAAAEGMRQIDECGCYFNNYRSNDRILPVMLMEDVEAVYIPNGNLTFPEFMTDNEESSVYDEPYDELLKKIVDRTDGLNHKTLQEVRSIWYHISRTAYRPEDIQSIYKLPDKMKRSRELIKIFKEAYRGKGKDLEEEPPDEVLKYALIPKKGRTKDFYLSTLLAYDWFYDYYRGGENALYRSAAWIDA